MRCFNHREAEAVGVCKHCQKALCYACANDLGFGLACRGVHENEVTSVSQVVARSVRIQAKGGLNRYAGAVFYVALGAIFAGYDLFFAPGKPGFGVVMGCLFIAYGLYVAAAVRRAYQPAAKV